MNTSNSNTHVEISLPHPVIVLGRDESGKAHASYFASPDGYLATKAAARMGMLALRVDNDGVRAFLHQLPKGKLFESGKAFVPFVKQDLYRQITLHLPEAERAQAEQVRAAPAEEVFEMTSESEIGKPKGLPEDWSKLKVGNIVLATDGPLEGWFESTIVEIKPNETLRLKWRDYLDLPSFGRRVDQVALIHPSYIER